jgi:hypothetical protein
MTEREVTMDTEPRAAALRAAHQADQAEAAARDSLTDVVLVLTMRHGDLDHASKEALAQYGARCWRAGYDQCQSAMFDALAKVVEDES